MKIRSKRRVKIRSKMRCKKGLQKSLQKGRGQKYQNFIILLFTPERKKSLEWRELSFSHGLGSCPESKIRSKIKSKIIRPKKGSPNKPPTK